MKKSLVVGSVIVAVGAAWTGASWYTGKLIEQHMGDMLTNVNLQIKKQLPDTSIKLVAKDYQRGTFSSHVRYMLHTDGNESSKTLLKPADEITIIQTISHGPFPLDQLKKLNLIPKMASVHSTLDNTPTMKRIFEITGGKSPINVDSRISYSGDASSDVVIIPFDYQKDHLTIKFSGLALKADVSKDMRDVMLTGKSDSLMISAKDQGDEKNQEGSTEQITLKGIALNSTHKLGKFDLTIGDQQLDINHLAINIDGKDTTALTGLHLKAHVGETDKYLNGKITHSIDSLNLHGNEFGSGKFIVNFDRLDGQALKQLADSYNQHIMQSLQQDKNVDSDKWPTQLIELFMSKLPALLQANPTFSIAPLSWKNSKGESTFTLNMELNDPVSPTTTGQGQDKLSIQYVKNVDAMLNIPITMATELTTQTAKLQGYSEEESQKMAQQQVQGLAAMGQMFKLTTNKDGAISSNFHYADNQVELNGQKMSLAEFINLFSLFDTPPQAPSQ